MRLLFVFVFLLGLVSCGENEKKLANATSNKRDTKLIDKKSKSTYKKPNNIYEIDELNKNTDVIEITVENLIKHTIPISVKSNNDSIFKIASHINKQIININCLKRNPIDSIFYFKEKAFTGAVKVLDLSFSTDEEEIVFTKYYSIKKGKLNGPFFQIQEGSLWIYGNYKDGKKHGWFNEEHGDLDWKFYNKVLYKKGLIKEHKQIDGYGRETLIPIKDEKKDPYKHLDPVVYQ